MTRMYIQPSWIDAASDHTEWSGGNGQYRGDRSADIATFDRNGRARVEAFSDDAIETRKDARKTSVPLKSRILPQSARLEKLTAEIIELEESYHKGEFTAEEYTLLRSVAFAKRDRAQILLDKAINVRPTQPQESIEDDDLPIESAYETNDSHSANSVCGVRIIDDLSDENCLKVFLQKACKGYKLAVHYKHKAAVYIQSLKDL